MNDQPGITRVRDAEIRVFDAAPDSDDASDMYVLEVLGVTVSVRLVRNGPWRTPSIAVETDHAGEFRVGVNEDWNTYGERDYSELSDEELDALDDEDGDDYDPSSLGKEDRRNDWQHG